jgi:hypothetical protein
MHVCIYVRMYVCRYVHVDELRLCLRTAATNGPIFDPPDYI